MRVLAALLALVAALSIRSTTAGAQTNEPIRIGAGPVDQATPLIYGVKAGIYKKYGINVEVVKLANGSAIASVVAGGSLQLGQASALAAVTAIAKGLPFTVIGNLASYDSEKPDFALLVAANAPIKYAEIPASAALAAMEQNRIVGATIYEPFLSADVASRKARILGYPYDAVAKHFSSALLFGSVKWVNEQEASLYVAAHENESAQLIAEFAGVDPSSIANIRHSVRGIVLNLSDVQPVIDTAAKYKIIPKAFPAQEMVCTCALKR